MVRTSSRPPGLRWLWVVDHQGLTVSDSRRDSPLDDSDSFRILLDTYRDRQNGFVFATNPAALEYDGQVSNEGGNSGAGGGGGGRQQAGSGGGFNLNWDGSWTVRTATTDAGWTAEFEIPFRTLRYEAGEREWGLNFQRTIRRRKEIAYWSPLPIQFDLMRVSMAGSLAGLNPPVQRNLQADPLCAHGGAPPQHGGSGHGPARRRRPRREIQPDAEPDARRHAQHRLRSGGSGRAAGEPRSVQPVLSRRSARSFSRTPASSRSAVPGEAELFFSRRIGIAESGEAIPIVGGARLSGRAGPVNIGVLNMQTDDADGQAAEQLHRRTRPPRLSRPLERRRDVRAARRRRATAPAATTTTARLPPTGGGASAARDSSRASSRARRRPALSDNQHAYQLGARNETQPLTLALTLHGDRDELQSRSRFPEPRGRVPEVRRQRVLAAAPAGAVEVPGDPSAQHLSRLLESRRLPGDRLLAHRQPLGAEEQLRVPHGHERHA